MLTQKDESIWILWGRRIEFIMVRSDGRGTTEESHRMPHCFSAKWIRLLLFRVKRNEEGAIQFFPSMKFIVSNKKRWASSFITMHLLTFSSRSTFFRRKSNETNTSLFSRKMQSHFLKVLLRVKFPLTKCKEFADRKRAKKMMVLACRSYVRPHKIESAYFEARPSVRIENFDAR